MRSRLRIAALLIIGIAVHISCRTPSDHSPGGTSNLFDNSLEASCKAQESGKDPDGNSVIICKQLYEVRPFVRPISDVIQGANVSISVTLDQSVGNLPGQGWGMKAIAVDRTGRKYELKDTDGGDLTKQSPIIVANNLPTNRWHFLIYRVEGKLSGNAIFVKKLEPQILLMPFAADSVLLGDWEGEMPVRAGVSATGKPIWAWGAAAKTVRFRMRFTKLKDYGKPIQDIGDSSPLILSAIDWPRSIATDAVIINATNATLASDGTCIPALTTHALENPLLGVSDAYGFGLVRFPNMHGAWDDHIVLEYPDSLYSSSNAMENGQHPFNEMHNYLRSDTPSNLSMRQDLHGNPVRQLFVTMSPVPKGASEGSCQ